jgi:phosphoglucosamine mutase
VGTLMTNMAVELALRAAGVELVRAKVGDRYVLEELSARGWQLGGEGSGHLLALDCHTTGDGIVSALQVLQAVRRRGCTLAQLLEGVTLFPQVLLNVRLVEGVDWKTHEGLARARAQAEQALAGTGRVLIRPSGTEPVLRIMVEARQAEQAHQLAGQMAQALAAN